MSLSLSDRFGDLDVRALAASLVGAAFGFLVLFFLVDRLERVAQSQTIVGDNRTWQADRGNELRLSGLQQGPLVGLETSAGAGLTVRAGRAALSEGGPVRPLVWMIPDEKDGDNKAKVQVSVIGNNGSVRLSRAGEPSEPQLLLRPENVKLRVETGVTIGDALAVPAIEIFFDKKPVPVTGVATSFIVPDGGYLAIEFPALPNGKPSGVTTTLGSVREEQEDTVLALGEVGLYQEGATAPYKALCAADRRYAWAPFFRPALYPVPGGTDCTVGRITGRGFGIGDNWIDVTLAGQAWNMEQGKPTASLWTQIEASPVLSWFIHWALPGACGWILGLIIWRRRTAAPWLPEEPDADILQMTTPPKRSRMRRARRS